MTISLSTDSQARPEPSPAREAGWLRVANALYGPLVVTASFLVATLPFAAAAAFSPDAGAFAPLTLAVGGISIGPAWVAALYALHVRSDQPFRRFVRGYRQAGRQALLFWAPFVIVLGVLALDLVVGGLPAPVVWLLGALGVFASAWAATVLVVIALFRFRLRDALRLGASSLLTRPGWLLANLALLVALVGVVLVGSEAAAGVLVAPFALLTLRASRGFVARLTEEFTE